MGISSVSPPDDPKQQIVMGYPSMDTYHQPPPHMYPPPPSAAYPAPHGYPSSSYQLPQGYASASSFQQNPYSQPYNDYYYQQHYKSLSPESTNNSSFARVMLGLMIVLVASMCMMSLVMWFLFGTHIPEFEVASLKVSNFTVADTNLTGIWTVDVSVSNTNKELAIHFDGVMSSIFYRDALLGFSSFQPFQVEKMQQSHLNFSVPSLKDYSLQSWVLPSLAKDRSNGVVVVSLRLAMKANYTAPNSFYRQNSLRVLCENMPITFSSTGEGTLAPGLENLCLIRILDSLKDDDAKDMQQKVATANQ